MDSFLLYLQDIYRAETVVRKEKSRNRMPKSVTFNFIKKREKNIKQSLFPIKVRNSEKQENVKHFLVFSVQTFEKKL